MNNFIYEIPTKIYFGENQLQGNLSKEIEKYGTKVLLVYGGESIKKIGLYEEVINEIRSSKIEIYKFSGIAI